MDKRMYIYKIRLLQVGGAHVLWPRLAPTVIIHSESPAADTADPVSAGTFPITHQRGRTAVYLSKQGRSFWQEGSHGFYVSANKGLNWPEETEIWLHCVSDWDDHINSDTCLNCFLHLNGNFCIYSKNRQTWMNIVFVANHEPDRCSKIPSY